MYNQIARFGTSSLVYDAQRESDQRRDQQHVRVELAQHAGLDGKRRARTILTMWLTMLVHGGGKYLLMQH